MHGRRPMWLATAALLLALAAAPPYARAATHSKAPAPVISAGFNRTADDLTGEVVFAVVIDAGSTGSRVSVFRFKQDFQRQSLKLLGEVFMQVRPGLSSFQDDPKGAAKSLAPLLAVAAKAVPPEVQNGTSLTLRATAGLRLIAKSKSEAILREVRSYFKTFPFIVAPDGVEILDGQSEGAFAWLTFNYLLGKLATGRTVADTVATVDLGGGSMQEAFALVPETVAKAPPGYTRQVASEKKLYDIYVHSYLGYGLMAGRAALIDADGDKTDRLHGCFAKGVALNYSYMGDEYALKPPERSGSFEACLNITLRALKGSKCPGEAGNCSFFNVWQAKPPGMRTAFYVSSFYWDRAVDTGIIPDGDQTDWKSTPAKFHERAKLVCGKSPAEVKKMYPDLPGWDKDAAAFLCADLTFLYAILTRGLNLTENTGFTLVRRILYNGEEVSTSWALGLAINSLSRLAQGGRSKGLAASQAVGYGRGFTLGEGLVAQSVGAPAYSTLQSVDLDAGAAAAAAPGVGAAKVKVPAAAAAAPAQATAVAAPKAVAVGRRLLRLLGA